MSVISAQYRFSASNDPDAGRPGGSTPPAGASQGDELPYRVELWSKDKGRIEQILAMTASGSIGYAAYHAATVEFPDRYIVLTHQGTVLSRWNGPSH